MNQNLMTFQDTMDHITRSKKLSKQMQRSISGTRVYDEQFQSEKAPYFPTSQIFFTESLTLIPARNAALSGKKTAVLNFANPVEPGGGVLRGANAQEEYLCRASTLYKCLVSPQARPYYDLHNKLLRENGTRTACFPATGQVIYSPDVTIIREDVGYEPGTADLSQQVYTHNWVQLDVLTCAAPLLLRAFELPTTKDLEELFNKRIRTILEVAIECGIQVLILGAFGCGAFRNPPNLVAQQFRSVLDEPRYRSAFQQVIFAVRRSGENCKNIEAFQNLFPSLEANALMHQGENVPRRKKLFPFFQFPRK